MKTPRSRLAATIAERSLRSNVSAKKLSQEIAAYLLAEGRTSELDSIIRDVMQYRADHGVVEVMAVSAHPLTDKVRKEITSVVGELYPKAKIIISEEHDDTVVGGVKIELANQQLDLSVRSKLNRFKQLTVTPLGV